MYFLKSCAAFNLLLMYLKLETRLSTNWDATGSPKASHRENARMRARSDRLFSFVRARAYSTTYLLILTVGTLVPVEYVHSTPQSA